MQLNRCPICHHRISLEALAQDEAGRELLGLLAKLDLETGTALAAYLGLFRSKTRDLANDRALKLAREALALGHHLTVAQAMRQTVESIREKGGKALTNHNYLKKVLADIGLVEHDAVGADLSARTAANANKNAPASRTAKALRELEDFGNE